MIVRGTVGLLANRPLTQGNYIDLRTKGLQMHTRSSLERYPRTACVYCLMQLCLWETQPKRFDDCYRLHGGLIVVHTQYPIESTGLPRPTVIQCVSTVLLTYSSNGLSHIRVQSSNWHICSRYFLQNSLHDTCHFRFCFASAVTRPSKLQAFQSSVLAVFCNRHFDALRVPAG